MRRLRRFFRHWPNWIGLLIVALFIGTAIAAPRLAPPAETDRNPALHLVPAHGQQLPNPPSAEHPLGTFPVDVLNHMSVFYNLVWGTRSALSFGLVAALLTAALGVLLGAAGAYAGGWINRLILRITDAFLTFPTVVAVVLITQLINLVIQESLYSLGLPAVAAIITGQSNLPGLLGVIQQFNPALIALVLFSWMPYARLTNALVLRLRQVDYIQAARALGASPARIILRHLIPNAISPSVVLAARDIGGLVLLQATLNFIGIPAGSPWGSALKIASIWIIGLGGNPLAWWWVFVPTTLAIVFFGTGWNLLGDGLNDWLNPRQS